MQRLQIRRFVSLRPGFSLIEGMLAVVMLSGAMLGLAASASVGIRNTSRARQDSQYWADAQQVMDSLMAKGFGNITGDSTSVRGRPVKWLVGSAAAAPQQVKLVVWRSGYQNRFAVVKDTIYFYLSKTTPGA